MSGLGVDPSVLPAFLMAMVLVELTPGPNLAYLALLSATRGRRAGLEAIAGITLGLTTWLLVTLFGLTQTPLHSPAGLSVLRWVGAAYLMWLALDALGSVRVTARKADVVHSPFVRGLLSNLLNPKAAIFYLALLPSFIRPAVGPMAGQILIFGFCHILISITVHTGVMLGAAEAASRMSPRGALLFRVFLAFGLAAAAVWLLVIPLTVDVSA